MCTCVFAGRGAALNSGSALSYVKLYIITSAFRRVLKNFGLLGSPYDIRVTLAKLKNPRPRNTPVVAIKQYIYSNVL